MAKLFNMFLVLLAIQFALLFFVAPTDQNNVLWSFVNNTSYWSNNSLIGWLVGISTTLAVIGIAASAFTSFKTDTLIFATAISSLMSIGAVFAQLYSVLLKDLSGWICEAESCTPASILTSILIGPLALYYVWTVIEWWRGKDN